MKKGFLYLTAIMDVYSRKILSLGISNTLDAQWCIDVFKDAVDTYGARNNQFRPGFTIYELKLES